jgi:hypothetical protein
MIEGATKIGCNRCKVPLSSVGEPQGTDLLSCPNCRISDSYDNVMLELDQRAADALRRALNRPVQPKTYRFALLFRERLERTGERPKAQRIETNSMSNPSFPSKSKDWQSAPESTCRNR